MCLGFYIFSLVILLTLTHWNKTKLMFFNFEYLYSVQLYLAYYFSWLISIFSNQYFTFAVWKDGLKYQRQLHISISNTSNISPFQQAINHENEIGTGGIYQALCVPYTTFTTSHHTWTWSVGQTTLYHSHENICYKKDIQFSTG